MIRYALSCYKGHQFEGWFRSSDDFDAQRKARKIECPICGTARVQKELMAPSVSTSRSKEARKDAATKVPTAAERTKFYAAVRKHVEDNFENVGDRFPDEARAIHDGDAEERPIYGEATIDEAKELIEDGVPVAALPPSEREVN